MNEFDRSCV